ncbi:MAG: hypothetical protein R3A10_04585 [Caldilineaceae bacterium]
MTTQAQILDLLRSLQEQQDVSIILITHDMGVIAEMADDVVVMYLGRGRTGVGGRHFHDPKHPYIRALLRSIPSVLAEPRTKLPPLPAPSPTRTTGPSAVRFTRAAPTRFPGAAMLTSPISSSSSATAPSVASCMKSKCA